MTDKHLCLMFTGVLLVMWLTMGMPLCFGSEDTPPPPREAAAFDFILWSGHRFAREPEEHERDFRYYRDLGFTHTLVGNADLDRQPRDVAVQLELARRYDMNIGLRLYFETAAARLGARLGVTEQEMIDRGILLSRGVREGQPAYNPLHATVIDHYAQGFAAIVAAARETDHDGRLNLFLIGSEMGWPFPRQTEDAYPEAMKLIVDQARLDGLTDFTPSGLRGWWVGPHQRGGDWRMRQAIETAILVHTPGAEFWVDPIWAIKIVHGFGGDWSYVGDDPKRVVPGVVNVKAMTAPAPAAHSVQLTRWSGGGRIPHDVLLESNLLSICLGVDKLYHWGIQTFEPGIDVYRGRTGKPSPVGFPRFAATQVRDWKALLVRLADKPSTSAGSVIRSRLSAELALRVEDQAAFLGGGGAGVSKVPGSFDDVPAADLDPLFDGGSIPESLKAQLVAAFNVLLTDATLVEEGVLVSAARAEPRVGELLARRGTSAARASDLEELNRLIIERGLGDALSQTESPNHLALWEAVDARRREMEPAIRTTGRLLVLRGDLFARWEPLGPRVALLGGVYRGDALKIAMSIGHLPYDLIRNPEHRRAAMASYAWAAVAFPTVDEQTYADLRGIEQAGGHVLVPPDFTAPTGTEVLARPVIWELPQATTRQSKQEERASWRPLAIRLRKIFHDASFRAYCDTESLDVILGAYRDGDCPLVMVVNDLRTVDATVDIDDDESSEQIEGRDDRFAGIGRMQAIDLLIRDPRPDLQAVDIDSGRTIALEGEAGAWKLRDSLPGGWYRLYAILPVGEPCPYPLAPQGPAMKSVQAVRQADGIRLKWETDVSDWGGSEVQWYRIERTTEGGPSEVVEIPGRVPRGPGGLVSGWHDAGIGGGRVTYRVRAVSPLRREGPWSVPVEVGPVDADDHGGADVDSSR